MALAAVTLLLYSCFRTPSLPRQDGVKGVVGVQNAGDFLASIGNWGIVIGAIALILSFLVWRIFGKGIAITVIISAVGAIAVGAAFTYIGPWLAWIIFGGFALVLLVAARILWMNRRHIIDRIEESTGLEIDGVPNYHNDKKTPPI